MTGELDTFTLIKDNVKNYRILTEPELQYLYQLTEEQKIELIQIYDRVIRSIRFLIE